MLSVGIVEKKGHMQVACERAKTEMKYEKKVNYANAMDKKDDDNYMSSI